LDENVVVIYWDASAILSVLFRDMHSDDAGAWSNRNGVHLVSTLAQAETHAVIARLKRERVLADILIEAALETFHEGPWRHLRAGPNQETVRTLATRWPLRGADLWHLATAKSVQVRLSELKLLTYDARLQEAAEGEGLADFAG
jgi:predicted nucleic acid-binding protein